jgi:GT2 family glycosyltransferase
LFAERGAGSLTVRVANTQATLTGSTQLAPAASPPLAATSLVFGDGGLRLHGWALDTRQAGRALVVRAFAGARQLAQCVAGDEHPALRAHAVGRHGFTLDLPLALADGQVHSIRVVDESGAALNGSPLDVCCFADGGKALLAAPDSLLGNVIDTCERYLPRSLGPAHYRAWSARFDAGQAAPPPLQVGIIVSGPADAAARARTAASLAAQAGVALSVYGAQGPAQPFERLLGQALAAGCAVIGCVRAGDTLVPQALAFALEGFALAGAQAVYSDSERDGAPWFKPAWNPDYALGSDYPLELLLVRAPARDAQGPLAASAAAFAWQALARAWQAGPDAIVHVPRVLYVFGAPVAPDELAARAQAAAAALTLCEPATRLLAAGAGGARRLVRPLNKRDRARRVSLIIPTRDTLSLLERCIETLARHTDWPELEIIIADNGSREAATLRYLKAQQKKGIRVLPMPGPFNFARLNNAAVAAAGGDIVGLLNNDIEALHAGWLDEMVGQLLRPGVGAVGAKLLWPNGMVQHGGVLLGVGNAAGHFGNRLADADWGDHGRNQLVQQVSGVTAACLLLRKKDYLALGGMDEQAFPVAFNDVDLCLKLRRAGKAIVWTPHARLLHAESASRGHEDTPQKRARAARELANLRQRWGPVLLRDPAYHPSLNLDPHSGAFGGLALPPRPRTPRKGAL